jgi:hypothetical protein
LVDEYALLALVAAAGRYEQNSFSGLDFQRKMPPYYLWSQANEQLDDRKSKKGQDMLKTLTPITRQRQIEVIRELDETGAADKNYLLLTI